MRFRRSLGSKLCCSTANRTATASGPNPLKIGTQIAPILEQAITAATVIASQAVDLRGPIRLGAGTAAAHRRVREVVPFLAEGDTLLPDLEPVRELIRSRALLG